LVEPKVQGNVGACARAARNFGIDDLVLVKPCEIGDEAEKRAMHGLDVLRTARSYDDLESALAKENIDIVHARSRVPAWIAFFACRRTRRVFITTCHGYYSAHFASRPMVWGKLAINAGINPLTALLEIPNGALTEDEYLRQVMAAAANEVAQVAAAQGIKLPYNDAANRTD